MNRFSFVGENCCIGLSSTPMFRKCTTLFDLKNPIGASRDIFGKKTLLSHQRKKLICGVKSSGNQAERDLRVTAKIFKQAQPEVNRVINEDV